MARYRIVCSEQEPADQPPTHAHIIAVGIGSNPQEADKRFTLQQVLNAFNSGDSFFTQGTQSGRVAKVERYWCSHCRKYFIRSKPDAIHDNNLDSLRRCNFN